MTFVKNYTPWNKGKKASEDPRKKISENNARFWLGKKSTLKHRKNMSRAMKGTHVAWNKGKQGLPSPLKGRKRPYTSLEHRRNLSIAIKKWHQRRKKHGSKT